MTPCIDVSDPNGTYTGQTDIDGDMRLVEYTDLDSRVDMGADETDCFPSDHEDYDHWVEVGKPDCWCIPRQCHGDADNISSVNSNPNKRRWVIQGDLDILLAGWGKKRTETADLPFEEYICASFARTSTVSGNVNKKQWVIQASLDILVANWSLKSS